MLRWPEVRIRKTSNIEEGRLTRSREGGKRGWTAIRRGVQWREAEYDDAGGTESGGGGGSAFDLFVRQRRKEGVVKWEAGGSRIERRQEYAMKVRTNVGGEEEANCVGYLNVRYNELNRVTNDSRSPRTDACLSLSPSLRSPATDSTTRNCFCLANKVFTATSTTCTTNDLLRSNPARQTPTKTSHSNPNSP